MATMGTARTMVMATMVMAAMVMTAMGTAWSMMMPR